MVHKSLHNKDTDSRVKRAWVLCLCRLYYPSDEVSSRWSKVTCGQCLKGKRNEDTSTLSNSVQSERS